MIVFQIVLGLALVGFVILAFEEPKVFLGMLGLIVMAGFMVFGFGLFLLS